MKMGMYPYKKIAVFNKKIYQTVKRADSYLTRWLKEPEQAQYEDPYICVYTDLTKDRDAAKTLRAWKEGFDFKKHHYVYLFSGAGDTRKKSWYMIREELYRPFMDKFMCGLTMEDVNKLWQPNPKKEAKHIMSALRFTNYLSMVSTSGYPVDVDLRRIIVIPDEEHVIQYAADYINAEDNNIMLGTEREEKFNMSDGGGCFRPGTFEEHAFTYRLPFHKGLLTELRDWDNVVPQELTDVWRKTWKRDDIDIILTESQFKAWKCYPRLTSDLPATEGWEDFVRCCESTGAEFNVCVESEDSSWLTTAYQPLQTLNLNSEEVAEILALNLNRLDRMLHNPPEIAKAIGLPVPDATVVNSRLYIAKVKEYIDSKISQLRCGKINMPGAFYFIAPDWRRFFAGAGLQAGECCCPDYEDGDILWLVRYPHMAMCEHIYLVNRLDKTAVAEGCIAVNAEDNSCLRLNAD